MLLLALTAGTTASAQELPCEAYSEASAVFTGVAGAPVKQWVQLPDQPPIEMKLTPILVDRAYLGVTTTVMYLTPRGIDVFATPGRTYLVYGVSYRPLDIVMASPGQGAKPIENAADDLAFLESVSPASVGGTITGVIEDKEIAYDHRTIVRGPVAGIALRIFNERYSTDVVTDNEGRFSISGIPAGLYQLLPQLPDALVPWDPTSRISALVRDGGCAVTPIAVRSNTGKARGVLRGIDGRPLMNHSVDLIPMDLQPDLRTGRIAGTGSVSTNEKGEFEFLVPPGRYYLGVNLYNSSNRHGESPRTYYPGTSDRASAVPVVVEAGRASDGLDFAIRPPR